MLSLLKITRQCRICHEDCLWYKLISPCKCKGTIKYVHKSCLNESLKYFPNRPCICGFIYKYKTRTKLDTKDFMNNIYKMFDSSIPIFLLGTLFGATTLAFLYKEKKSFGDFFLFSSIVACFLSYSITYIYKNSKRIQVTEVQN